MKDETQRWLAYADENLASAKVLLDNGLYNPCLQNVQQAVEKMLKAVLIESHQRPKKTHSLNELMGILEGKGLKVSLTADEIDLLDSVYLPSKYTLWAMCWRTLRRIRLYVSSALLLVNVLGTQSQSYWRESVEQVLSIWRRQR